MFASYKIWFNANRMQVNSRVIYGQHSVYIYNITVIIKISLVRTIIMALGAIVLGYRFVD